MLMFALTVGFVAGVVLVGSVSLVTLRKQLAVCKTLSAENRSLQEEVERRHSVVQLLMDIRDTLAPDYQPPAKEVFRKGIRAGCWMHFDDMWQYVWYAEDGRLRIHIARPDSDSAGRLAPPEILRLGVFSNMATSSGKAVSLNWEHAKDCTTKDTKN